MNIGVVNFSQSIRWGQSSVVIEVVRSALMIGEEPYVIQYTDLYDDSEFPEDVQERMWDGEDLDVVYLCGLPKHFIPTEDAWHSRIDVLRRKIKNKWEAPAILRVGGTQDPYDAWKYHWDYVLESEDVIGISWNTHYESPAVQLGIEDMPMMYGTPVCLEEIPKDWNGGESIICDAGNVERNRLGLYADLCSQLEFDDMVYYGWEDGRGIAKSSEGARILDLFDQAGIEKHNSVPLTEIREIIEDYAFHFNCLRHIPDRHIFGRLENSTIGAVKAGCLPIVPDTSVPRAEYGDGIQYTRHDNMSRVAMIIEELSDSELAVRYRNFVDYIIKEHHPHEFFEDMRGVLNAA